MALPAGPFDGVALLLQRCDDGVAVVALHFNDAVFYRAARAALGLELFAQLGQRLIGQRHTFDDGDAFAFAAFGFELHPHNAVARLLGPQLRGSPGFANAMGQRLAAGGAGAA